MIRGKSKKRWVLAIGLLGVYGLMASTLTGCFFFEPREAEPTVSTSEPIDPSKKPPSEQTPPKDQTTDPAAPVSAEWAALPRLSSDKWKAEEGLGSPILCRTGESKQSLWCFSQPSRAWVELWRSEEQSVVDIAYSVSHSRIALLLKDASGTLTIQSSDAPFTRFRSLRTFPLLEEGDQPKLAHVVFLGEELIAYGPGAMLSERSDFLKSLPGAGETPSLGKMSYLEAGYLLAVDLERGVVVQNSPTALTSWSPVQLPEEGTNARAISVSTSGSALSMVYNDGSVYWRCSESEGLRLMRFAEKVQRAIWLRTAYGLQLVVQTARRVDLVTTVVKAPLTLPSEASRVLDVGALQADQLLLKTDKGLLRGVVKPNLATVTCR